MNIPAKVLTMATSKTMRRTICAYLIKNNKNSWMVSCNTCNQTASIIFFFFFFCHTLASHSIPATDMPSSITTVIQPTILMSFSSSTMMALFSWMQYKIYHICKRDQMFPAETFSTWNSAIKFLTLHTFNNSITVSANPTTYMATATALAKAKIRPMEPPNSGPKLRDIK